MKFLQLSRLAYTIRMSKCYSIYPNRLVFRSDGKRKNYELCTKDSRDNTAQFQTVLWLLLSSVLPAPMISHLNEIARLQAILL
jgi:hypothetical protein